MSDLIETLRIGLSRIEGSTINFGELVDVALGVRIVAAI